MPIPPRNHDGTRIRERYIDLRRRARREDDEKMEIVWSLLERLYWRAEETTIELDRIEEYLES